MLCSIAGHSLLFYQKFLFFLLSLNDSAWSDFINDPRFDFGAQGKLALGGFLAGATLCSIVLALTMANAGGAWDNAKKYIEAGNLGGKGSNAHKAAVVGDTVGDPFKDTSGPSLNILIKLVSILSLLLAMI